MNQHESDIAALDEENPTEISSQATPAADLYFGDKGELSADVRRVLVHLVRGPSIEERETPNLWVILVNNEEILKKRLADMFLDLIVDTESKFAYIRQSETGDVESVKLVREKQLSLIESLLLLFLRQRLAKASSEGVRAILAPEEIHNYMAVYEKSDSKDHAGFGKRVDAAITKLKTYHIVRRVGPSWEISPALKLMITAEEVQSLTQVYERLAQGDIFDESAAPAEGDD